MPGRRFRIYSKEFKLAAVRRVLAGEKIRAVEAWAQRRALHAVHPTVERRDVPAGTSPREDEPCER